MNGDNERQLRDRLGGALDTITPVSPPVGAVIRQGRNIKTRRRIGVVAGLAVAVGLVAAAPSVIGQAKPQPAAPPHYQVTVNPQAKNAPAGLIASGTTDGRSWRVRLASDGRAGETAFAPDFPEFGVGDETGGSPATFTGAGGGAGGNSLLMLVAAVRADVSEITMRLPRGTVIDLHPVAFHGQRWIGVVLPWRLQIIKAVAYSGHREVAYAVPFGTSTFNLWLRPGQQGEARHTFLVGSGIVDGRRWSWQARTGPWGNCFQAAAGGDSYCPDGSAVARGQVATVSTCSVHPGFYTAGVAPAVRVLRFRMSDGSMRFAPAVSVLGLRFAAVKLGRGQRMVSWSAYGASGQRLGTGKGWSCGP
jgi:hypothetical protein